MIPYRRKILLLILKASDLLIMLFAFGLAAVLEHYRDYEISLRSFLSMRISVKNFLLFLLFLFIWNRLFWIFKLYHSRRLISKRKEIMQVFSACLLGSSLIYLLGILFQIEVINPFFIGIFFLSSSFLSACSRMVQRLLLKFLRLRGRNLRHVVVVGTNPRAIQFAKRICSQPELGYQLKGFVDEEWPGLPDFSRIKYPLITDLNGFSDYLRKEVLDEVAIDLPLKTYYHQAAKIVAMCEQQGIIVRYPSKLFDLKIAAPDDEEFDAHSFIAYKTGTMHGLPLFLKRTFDYVASIILLILFAPLLFIIALLIKITSPGPVFFVQQRIGLGKRKFNLYKFRTMVPNADKLQEKLEHLNEASGPVFKLRNDPRITRLGRFLRKTSLDELPQLLNVLMGDMSLVGPRPLPLRDYEGFSEDGHRRRFSVHPGLTCLWQVNGRSDLPFAKWMELDMQYIDNWSFWLDFKILFKTIPSVLFRIGAH